MNKSTIVLYVIIAALVVTVGYLAFDLATPGMIEVKRRHVEVQVENSDGSLFTSPNLYLNEHDNLCFDVHVINNNTNVVELKLDHSENIRWNYDGSLLEPRQWLPVTLTITDPEEPIYFYIYGWEHYEES